MIASIALTGFKWIKSSKRNPKWRPVILATFGIKYLDSYVCICRSKTGAARLSAARLSAAISSKKSKRQRFSVTSNESDGPTPHLTKVSVIKKFPSINNF